VRDDTSSVGVRRQAVGRVLGLIGLAEVGLTTLLLLVGWLNADFVGFAVSVGLAFLFTGDFLRRGQPVVLRLLGLPVGFALGQGYVLVSQGADADRFDALVAGSVGALVGLMLGYVAAGQHETRLGEDAD
jgi:hypothetical protein